MPPLFPLTLSLYAAACALYCVAVSQALPPLLYRAARGCLLLALVSQAADIGWLCLHGQPPPTDAREAVFFISWLMVGVYLLATLRTPLPVVAALLLPVSMVLQVAARLAPAGAPEAHSLLRSLHVLSASLGTAILALGAGGSVVYLLLERQLKRHHLSPLGRRGPPLQTLDTLNRRTTLLGFPVFTLALVTGAAFLARQLYEGIPLRSVLARPQYVLALLSWLLFASLLLGRVTAGLRGRRAALLTLCGFGAVLAVLTLYYLRGLTGGGAP
ncbi:MAG: cytochrome c biogenesis protein CcsA [Myxococcales bacterium]|nr:cytochrome c biogenesis protein CcsA [Myxococcota bacterium]MDW8283565.1 cytochrome c biogenesis protein CcsA [Myxococcales bacterium]